VATFWRALQEGADLPTPDYVALQVPATQGDTVIVDERFVDAAHRLGVAVHVWTVNDEAGMARLLDLGVDGIISDLPSPLVSMVAARGLVYRP
jgi:glycerophosphoryl diester phosphodiesterase